MAASPPVASRANATIASLPLLATYTDVAPATTAVGPFSDGSGAQSTITSELSQPAEPASCVSAPVAGSRANASTELAETEAA